MNGQNCDAFRDRLIELRDGSLSALETAETRAHLARCAECAAEAGLLRSLSEGRRRAPAGFADGVMAAWREEGSRAAAARGASARGLRPLALPLAAAAAGVLLAGVLLSRGADSASDPEAVAVAASEAGLAILPWPGEDGVLAGAPALDALSNDEIEALLEELDS